jgi:hypothetical protein
MSADGFSLDTNINNISAVGYNISWTNGASGTFQVEVCNDHVIPPGNTVPVSTQSGTWVPLTLTVPVTSTGTANTAYIDIVGVSAAWIRLHFVHTSGSGGTFTATLAGKVQ